MRYAFLLCTLVLLGSQVAQGDQTEFRFAIDFEDRPSPDLSTIDNIYHGGNGYIYAFLVVKGTEADRAEMYVSAFDIGYRLISSDESVLNHGFYRLSDWAGLEMTEIGFPCQGRFNRGQIGRLSFGHSGRYFSSVMVA